MAYNILARKWRPQDFSSVVGQEPIVTALRNAITEDRIAPAYLFSGIRGVGKTSVARVLAKALNCERGPAADPCNECITCSEITAGADMDVLEIDAATFSKVEQIRELTESLKYRPTRNRYRVVVLDEVHRLSRQAFDALLKIVEEPPSHLIFIFATTEIETVPATILSRCQEFTFRRVPLAELVEHLRAICREERIEATDASLRLIARAGEGSVRDSVALLDQLATYGSGNIPDAEAARLLGGVDLALLERLLIGILAGQGSEVATVVAQIENDGWDPRHVYTQFLSYCRDALHLALGKAAEAADLPLDEARRLAEIAGSAGYENLLRLLQLLLTSESAIRRSEMGGLALEIAWLRAAELPKLTRLESLLADPSASEPPEPSPEPKTVQPPRQTEAPQPVVEKPPEKPAEAGPSDAATGVQLLLEELSRRKQSLAAYLAQAQQLEFAENRLVVIPPAGDTELKKALSRRSNRELLNECLSNTFGDGVSFFLREAAPVTQMRPDGAPAGNESVRQHPTVQAVLELFGGTLQPID